MSNLKQRLDKLEGQTGVSEAVIVKEPWETVEQAKERHFAQYPEHKFAKKLSLICIRNFSRER